MMHDRNDDDNDDDDEKEDRMQGKLSPPIGLINPSGTACYINASLLLLCYTCTPIVTHYIHHQSTVSDTECRTCMTQDSNHNSLSNRRMDEFEYELILLLCRILCVNSDRNEDEVITKATVVVVDPTRFYQSLLLPRHQMNDRRNQNSILRNIRYTKCDDAVTTLIQLIQFLQEKSFNDDDVVSLEANIETVQPHQEQQQQKRIVPPSPQFNLVDRLLLSGKVYSVLTGFASKNITATTTTTTTTATNTSTTSNTAHTEATDTKSDSTRTKVLKVRPLTNPLPVHITPLRRQQPHPDMSCCGGGCTGTVYPSLQEVLHNALCTEQTVEGYTWHEMNRRSNTEDAAVDHVMQDETVRTMTTTRRLHVLSFPPIFMIHLQRFTMKSESCENDYSNYNNINADDLESIPSDPGATDSAQGTSIVTPIEDSTSHILIPELLDMSIYMSTQQPEQEFDDVSFHGNSKPSATIAVNTTTDAPSSIATISRNQNGNDQYHLVGGILHIHDYNDREEQPIGHYVTVIKKKVGEKQQWYLIDDEIVVPVSIDQVILWLGGGWYSDNTKSDNIDDNDRSSTRQFARGILLVYHRNNYEPTLDEIGTAAWNGFKASMINNPPFVRKQTLASPLQSDISSASMEALSPGAVAATKAQHVITNSYWLDSSSDDDD